MSGERRGGPGIAVWGLTGRAGNASVSRNTGGARMAAIGWRLVLFVLMGMADDAGSCTGAGGRRRRSRGSGRRFGLSRHLFRNGAGGGRCGRRRR